MSAIAMKSCRRLCCVICAWSISAAAIAQTYPGKPVRFIVPFAPGGGNDIIARIISAKLTASWGQQVIVDNRPGAGGNIAGEITAKAASGTNIIHIPYSGAGPALNDLLAGQVQIMFMVPATAMAHIQAGRLRALGVSSLKRSALASDVPTVAESGVNGFEGGAWYGVVVPAHTPRDIVLKLNTDIRRVLQQPEYRSK